jgi:hypothetical protein
MSERKKGANRSSKPTNKLQQAQIAATPSAPRKVTRAEAVRPSTEGQGKRLTHIGLPLTLASFIEKLPDTLSSYMPQIERLFGLPMLNLKPVTRGRGCR